MSVMLLAIALLVLTAAVVVLAVLVARAGGVEPEAPDGLHTEVLERIARMEGDLDGRLRSIDGRVDGITSMFASAQGRGGWGELSLRQALEHAGLVEDRDFTLNRASGSEPGRPDAVIRLPDGRYVVIDAKFPVARFAEACRAEEAVERDAKMVEHGKALVKMARDLKGRGYHAAAAGGYVVMYLPDESLYVEAMRANPTLFSDVLGEHVLLAGPATLLALIGVAAQVINEYRAVEEARVIVADTRELHSRLATFARHLGDVGKKLNAAVKGYNTAVGSWETRLLPQVAKVAAHGATGDAPQAPAVVDTPVRQPPEDGEPSLTLVG
jgi:DNA recombination protein RmuC